MKNLLIFLMVLFGPIDLLFANENNNISPKSSIYIFMDTNYGAVVSRYNLRVEGVEMPQIHGYKFLEFVVPAGKYFIEADRTDIGGTSINLRVGNGEKHFIFVDPVGFPRPKPILRIVDEIRGRQGVGKSVQLIVPAGSQEILANKGIQLANAEPVLNDGDRGNNKRASETGVVKLVNVNEQDKLVAQRIIEAEIKLRELQQLALEAQKKEQARVGQDSKQKEYEKLLAEQKAKDQNIVAEAAKQKDQERLMADQNIKEQLRIAEEAAKASALELSKLKQELASIKLRKEGAIPTASNRKALVIGNDNYSDVPKLANARQDANAVGRTLSELGYKVMVKNDLNEKDMKATLRQFKSDLEGGDEVIIFYAGHGVQLGSTNYLLPIDIKGESEDQVRDDAIQLQRLLDDMSEKKVKLTLAMIDACRDNPFPKSGRTIGSRGLAPTTAATGQMIIFSAGSGQQALDKLGPNDKNPNGLFTRMLLSEMRAPGVRVDNMIREVRRKVVEAAKSVGHDQVPAIYDQVVGDFYFNK
jgi:hypothetical protein